MKISGFIRNIYGNILVGKYFWPVSVVYWLGTEMRKTSNANNWKTGDF